MHRDTLVVLVLVVLVLGIVYTSTDDPAKACCETSAWWNHAPVGAIVMGLAAPVVWRALDNHAGARWLGAILLFGVLYYMFFVRGW
ncbi:MAG: hypothetical protein WC565_06780 [Parcubacteria group bacterium]